MGTAGHQLTKLLLWIRPCVEKIIRAFSLPGRGPFFKSEQFAWIAPLEENWKKIRGELVDFVRPLPFFVSLLNHLFLFLMRPTPFIAAAIHKQEQWSKEL